MNENLQMWNGHMKPILFNTKMVRAILEGRKTATRRLVTPMPPPDARLVMSPDPDNLYGWDESREIPDLGPHDRRVYYPRYYPGYILYVRETWTKLFFVDTDGYTHYDQPMYYYAADGEPDITLIDPDGFEEDDQRIRWHPSIHMPKEAARIFLRVTNVRVERLQEITEVGVAAEGCGEGAQPVSGGPFGVEDDPGEWTAREHFAGIWDSTIKPEKLGTYGWAANPWVWVIEFERCEKPEVIT